MTRSAESTRTNRYRLPRCRRCGVRPPSLLGGVCDACYLSYYRLPLMGSRCPTELLGRRIAYYAQRAALGLDLHGDPTGRPV